MSGPHDRGREWGCERAAGATAGSTASTTTDTRHQTPRRLPTWAAAPGAEAQEGIPPGIEAPSAFLGAGIEVDLDRPPELDVGDALAVRSSAFCCPKPASHDSRMARMERLSRQADDLTRVLESCDLRH